MKNRDMLRHHRRMQRRECRHRAIWQAMANRRIASEERSFKITATSSILDCRISRSVWSDGHGKILLSRVLADGRIAFAVFEVDVFAGGAKIAISGVEPRAGYEKAIERVSDCSTMDASGPATARKIVEDALADARSDDAVTTDEWLRFMRFFGDIDRGQCRRVRAFGVDGRPQFALDNADSLDCRQVLEAMHA